MRPVTRHRQHILRYPSEVTEDWVVGEVFKVDAMKLVNTNWGGQSFGDSYYCFDGPSIHKDEGIVTLCYAYEIKGYQCEVCTPEGLIGRLRDPSDFIDPTGAVRNDCGCVWRSEFPTCSHCNHRKAVSNEVPCSVCADRIRIQLEKDAASREAAMDAAIIATRISNGIMKQCTKCGKAKGRCEFIGSRSQETKWCIACLDYQRKKGATYYGRHKDEMRAREKNTNRANRRKIVNRSSYRSSARLAAIQSAVSQINSARPSRMAIAQTTDYLAMFPVHALDAVSQTPTQGAT